MEIKRVCLIGPEAMGASIEQGCKKVGIEFKRVNIERKIGDLKEVDLLIDQFFGDAPLKQKIIEKAGGAVSEKTILASNPFFISLTQIGSFAKRPDKVIGFLPPFYSGVNNFVEIVVGEETSEETFQSLRIFLERIGFNYIKSKDYAGCVLNRVLASMINEATYVYMHGLATMEGIDQMMKLGANFPLGPFEYADEIGLDNILMLLNLMRKELGPKYRPCPLLVRRVEAGCLGKKTGKGFYDYPSNHPNS